MPIKQKYIFHLEVFPDTYDRVLAMPATCIKDCIKTLKRWSDYNCETKGRELINYAILPGVVTLHYCGRDIIFKYITEEIED